MRKYLGLFLVIFTIVMISGMNVIYGATSDIYIKTVVGFDDRTIGQKANLNLQITNKGEDIDGTIEFLTQDDYSDRMTKYTDKISIQANSTKNIIVPISVDGVQTIQCVIYNNGQKVYDKQIFNYEKVGDIGTYDTTLVGALTDDKNKMLYIQKDYTGVPYYDGSKQVSYEQINPINHLQLLQLTADNIGETVSTLNDFGIIVIDNFNTSTLSDMQIEALKQWVSNGGNLVVGTGSSASNTLSGLKDKLLKVDSIDKYTKDYTIKGEKITMNLVKVNGEENYPYITQLGSGKVVVLDFSISEITNPLLYPYVHNIIATLVSSDAILDMDNSDSIVQNSKLSVSSYSMILIIYILAACVLSYFVLRKMRKKEYIWIVAPIASIICFIVLKAGSNAAINGSLITQVNVAKLNKDGSAKVKTSITAFNVSKDDLTLMTGDIPLRYNADNRYGREDSEIKKVDVEVANALSNNPEYRFINKTAYNNRYLSTDVYSGNFQVPEITTNYDKNGQVESFAINNTTDYDILIAVGGFNEVAYTTAYMTDIKQNEAKDEMSNMRGCDMWDIAPNIYRQSKDQDIRAAAKILRRFYSSSSQNLQANPEQYIIVAKKPTNFNLECKGKTTISEYTIFIIDNSVDAKPEVINRDAYVQLVNNNHKLSNDEIVADNYRLVYNKGQYTLVNLKDIEKAIENRGYGYLSEYISQADYDEQGNLYYEADEEYIDQVGDDQLKDENGNFILPEAVENNQNTESADKDLTDNIASDITNEQ